MTPIDGFKGMVATEAPPSFPLPSEVMQNEGKREYPWTSMFGCSETESLAKHVVEFLAANGDAWTIALPADVFESLRDSKRYLNHIHSAGSCPPFQSRYLNVSRQVNTDFIKSVTRS